jgi:hypothetical protein
MTSISPGIESPDVSSKSCECEALGTAAGVKLAKHESRSRSVVSPEESVELRRTGCCWMEIKLPGK